MISKPQPVLSFRETAYETKTYQMLFAGPLFAEISTIAYQFFHNLKSKFFLLSIIFRLWVEDG